MACAGVLLVDRPVRETRLWKTPTAMHWNGSIHVHVALTVLVCEKRGQLRSMHDGERLILFERDSLRQGACALVFVVPSRVMLFKHYQTTSYFCLLLCAAGFCRRLRPWLVARRRRCSQVPSPPKECRQSTGRCRKGGQVRDLRSHF